MKEYFLFIYGFSTYLGEPIPYDPDVSTEALVARVKKEIEQLIETHQRRPGSITRALLDRFDCFSKKQL